MFHGSLVALVTPMHAGVAPDTGLDEQGLTRLVEFHIDNTLGLKLINLDQLSTVKI